MNWRRRLKQWITALRLAHGEDIPIPWLKMLRGFAAPVPKRIWVARIRICRQCPLFDVEHYICLGQMGPLRGVGCHCYLPFKALSPEPYAGIQGRGCYGRALFGEDFGWPRFEFTSRRQRWTAFACFLLGR